MSVFSKLDAMTVEEKLALLTSIQESIQKSKESHLNKRIGENVNLVVSALKKIESDLYDKVTRTLEEKAQTLIQGAQGADGRPGRDGVDGKPGRDGINGKDGTPGRDGADGQDGVSVTNAYLDFDNSLVIELSDGRQINAGEVLPPDIAEKLKIIVNTSTGGVGLPEQTGNSGKYLTTDGANLSWGAVGAVSSVASADGSVTVTTVSGAVDLATYSSPRLIAQVRNETGATLTKGTVVYISGASGNKATVSKAIATSDSTSAQTFALIFADITNNQNGYAIIAGELAGLDTSAFTTGAQLYLSSTTAGGYTSTKQYAPNHLVYVGVVTRSHATQGTIEVRIQNGYEMDELHDVSAQNPTSGQILIYDATALLWKKANLTAGAGIAVTNGAGSITVAVSTRVVTISDGTSITINADTTDIATQANTQVAGTLTLNAPTGTPVNGQRVILRLTSTNVQTFSWNPVFVGSTDLALPTASSGSSKVDYMGFIYNSTAAKWHLLAKVFGF